MIRYEMVPDYLAQQTKDDADYDTQTGEMDVAVMHFDHEGAKGQVALVRGGYGAEIWVDGRCLGLIDLYYRAQDDGPENEAGKLHLRLDNPDNPDGDALVDIYILNDRVQVELDAQTDPILQAKGGEFKITMIREKDEIEDAI